MYKIIIAVILSVVVILAALIIMAPAWLLDSVVSQATKGQWRIAEARGSLWDGSGVVAIQSDKKTTTLTALVWRFEKSALFSGTARWHFGNNVNTLDNTLNIHLGSLEVEKLNLTLNAEPLLTLMPTRMVEAMTGTITLTSPKIGFDGKERSGTLNARWENAAVMVSQQPIILGEVRGTLAGDTATVNNADGELAVNGSLKVAPSGKPLSGSLALKPDANTPAGVKQLINTLSRPAADGTVTVRF